MNLRPPSPTLFPYTTLFRSGAGTLTLASGNGHTGTTTVNAGTLAYGGSNVLSTGAVTVDGATAILAMGANRTDDRKSTRLTSSHTMTAYAASSLTRNGSFAL